MFISHTALDGGKGMSVNLEQFSIGAVAFAFKRYLRECEPVFPFKQYQTLLRIQGQYDWCRVFVACACMPFLFGPSESSC
jgi:hypothetical protein